MDCIANSKFLHHILSRLIVELAEFAVDQEERDTVATHVVDFVYFREKLVGHTLLLYSCLNLAGKFVRVDIFLFF